jgi:hypothetical protein
MKTLAAALFLLPLFACVSPDNAVDFDKLEKQYSQPSTDSLKLEAAQYLRREMQGQTSDMPIFIDATGRIVTISLDSFSSLDNLLAHLEMLNLEPGSLAKNDKDILRTSFIENEINTSASHQNKYPWNKDIPKEVFLDYLLPYKIHNEYPDNWRHLLKQKVDSLISLWELKFRKSPSNPSLFSSEEFYYDLIVNTASQWFKYGPDVIRITEDPSYKELNLLRRGGCKKEAFFNAYVLRSAGLPATVDVIPHWGSKNGTHAGDVYWNNAEKKMTPGPGRRFERPAKVFRLTFRNHSSWARQIKPFVSDNDFLLNFLRNDNWLDVTNEHTITSDITLPIKAANDRPVPTTAYICVFDYGAWEPLYWGPVNNDLVVFKNMGRNVIYRMATFKHGLDFCGEIFLLDSDGQIKYFCPNQQKTQTMKLQKLNSGKEAWVAKNVAYTLYLLGKDQKWHKVAEDICRKDAMIEFRDIPSGGLYRLVKSDSPQQKERIFAFEDNQQVWY